MAEAESKEVNAGPVAAARLPVSVILERQPARQGPWEFVRWSALGVVTSPVASPRQRQRSLIRAEGERQQYLWSGLVLALHKDETESYWFNLMGRRPSLFVICRKRGDDCEPIAVHADHDQAGAYMETDDDVFSVPIPQDVHQWVERYLLENYRPEARKQRKRKRWNEESDSG